MSSKASTPTCPHSLIVLGAAHGLLPNALATLPPFRRRHLHLHPILAGVFHLGPLTSLLLEHTRLNTLRPLMLHKVPHLHPRCHLLPRIHTTRACPSILHIQRMDCLAACHTCMLTTLLLLIYPMLTQRSGSHPQYPPLGTSRAGAFYTPGYAPSSATSGPIDPALLLSRPPLEDSTTAVVNGNGKRTLEADSSSGAAKRSRGSRGRSRGRGRGRGRGGSAPPVSIGPSTPGAAAVAPPTPGGSSTPVQPAPLSSFGSVIRKTSSQGPGPSTQLSASDVWFHVYSLQGSRDQLSVADLPVNQPRMYDKPSDRTCDFVACRFCKYVFNSSMVHPILCQWVC